MQTKYASCKAKYFFDGRADIIIRMMMLVEAQLVEPLVTDDDVDIVLPGLSDKFAEQLLQYCIPDPYIEGQEPPKARFTLTAQGLALKDSINRPETFKIEADEDGGVCTRVAISFE